MNYLDLLNAAQSGLVSATNAIYDAEGIASESDERLQLEAIGVQIDHALRRVQALLAAADEER